jgi:hypothetical protein
MENVGYTWLQEQFELPAEPLPHASRIGSPLRVERKDGSVEETYGPLYRPKGAALEQVQFALKYDFLNLGILRRVFQRLPVEEVAEFVETQPSGKYARIVGYLYENLTGMQLPVADRRPFNYVPLLDSERYITAAKPVVNKRWRVADNLLGTFAYCPVVRRTAQVDEGTRENWTAKIEKVLAGISSERLGRALSYLYFKETKSSYAIERETATGDREHRFVGVLKNAGALSVAEVLSEPFLTRLQNLIVDPRYAQPGYRQSQNYISQSMPDFSELIHYISPPPTAVRPLMEGLLNATLRQEGLHPVIRAVAASFTFVYIHPFEDGNGRIHRYLLHDFLARDRFTPPGILLPVSATMLAHERAYDVALEDFSKKILPLAKFTIDGKGVMTVTNHDQLETYYRFPDLTPQVEYLFATIAQTIRTELPAELEFLRKFDLAHTAICQIVDMPDKKLRLLLNLLRQNKGRLSKNKRADFSELSDREVEAIEAAFTEAFQDNSKSE